MAIFRTGANFIAGVPVTRGPMAAAQTGEMNRATTLYRQAATERLEMENAVAAETMEAREAAREAYGSGDPDLIEAFEQERPFMARQIKDEQDEQEFKRWQSIQSVLANTNEGNYPLNRDTLSELMGQEMPEDYDWKTMAAFRQFSDDAIGMAEAVKYYRATGDNETADMLEETAEVTLQAMQAKNAFLLAEADAMRRGKPTSSSLKITDLAEDGGTGRYLVASDGSKVRLGDAPGESRSASDKRALRKLTQERDESAEIVNLLADAQQLVSRDTVGLLSWWTRGKELAEGYSNPEAEQPATDLREIISLLQAKSWRDIVGSGQISKGDYQFLEKIFTNPGSLWESPASARRKLGRMEGIFSEALSNIEDDLSENFGVSRETTLEQKEDPLGIR